MVLATTMVYCDTKLLISAYDVHFWVYMELYDYTLATVQAFNFLYVSFSCSVRLHESRSRQLTLKSATVGGDGGCTVCLDVEFSEIQHLKG